MALAIIAVLAVMAVGDLSSMMGRYRLNAAAQDLAKRVVTARMQAIGDNRDVALVLVDSDAGYENGQSRNNVGRWEIHVDDPEQPGLQFTQAVNDSVYDLNAGPNAHRGISIEPWAPINGPTGYSLPDHIVFSPRGWLLNDAADFDGGVIRIVLRNKAAPFVEQRVVRIDRAGNARIAAVE